MESTIPKVRPEPHVGARVRILGGVRGTILHRDHDTRWVIEVESAGRVRRLSLHPGQFRVVTEQEANPS